MSAFLLDTNALIYHYTGDPLGQRVEVLRRTPTNRFYVTNLTVVEMRSALAGSVRRGEITRSVYKLVIKRFDYDISSLGTFKIQPTRRQYVEPAIRLFDDFALRQGLALATLDCLHLLSALDLQQREPALRLVTADRAFANVAQIAGVEALLLGPAGTTE